MKRREFLAVLGGGIVGAAVPRRPDRSLVPYAGETFVERWSWAMGQPVHLQLYAVGEAAGYAAAQAAFAELRRVEGALSRFDDASDLSELNRRAGRGPVVVGPDLAVVLRWAERVRASSGGAFDPAVEPLMRAWGFHAVRAAEPTRVELAEACAAVRAADVRVLQRSVTLGSTSTQLDLGGIGVGYALDRAGAVLRRAGIRRALLDVSGDIFALGAPPGESGWLVAIADPGRAGGRTATIRLRDMALATSSNTVSVIRWGHAVRGHVMDPWKGNPAEALVQATVVARTGIEADAWSTAMLVTGRTPAAALRTFRVAAPTMRASRLGSSDM